MENTKTYHVLIIHENESYESSVKALKKAKEIEKQFDYNIGSPRVEAEIVPLRDMLKNTGIIHIIEKVYLEKSDIMSKEEVAGLLQSMTDRHIEIELF